MDIGPMHKHTKNIRYKNTLFGLSSTFSYPKLCCIVQYYFPCIIFFFLLLFVLFWFVLVLLQWCEQVQSQRWARLENFPHKCLYTVAYFLEVTKSHFLIFLNREMFFFLVAISIVVHPKQISVVSKRDKQNKNKNSSAHTFPPSIFKFSSSPFTISSLFLSIFPFFFIASLFPFLLFFLIPLFSPQGI